MDTRGSEAASGDVWGAVVDDYEVALAALDNEADEGNADSNGDQSASDDTSKTQANEDTKGEHAATAAQTAEEKFEKWQRELLEAIDKGDTNNSFYKGLQKVVNKKQSAIEELQKLVEASQAKLQEYEDQFEAMGEGMTWLTETTMGALPDNVSKEALLKLSQKANERLQGKLQGKAAQQAKPAERGDGNEQRDEPEEVKAYKAKFLNGRKEAAKRAGVNPDDSALDYGDYWEPVVERIEKFEASLLKLVEANEQARLAAVSQKNDVIGTRSAGGGNTKSAQYDGLDSLQRGARSRLSEMRKAAGV